MSKKAGVSMMIVILAVVQAILMIKGLWELSYYNFLLLVTFIIIYFLNAKFNIPEHYLAGLIFVGVLNAASGLIIIGGVKLYYTYFGMFKIDMAIHLISSFFITLTIYSIFEKNLRHLKKMGAVFLCGLAAMGLGAFFEILELLGVVLFHNAGVGDYLNNTLDLVFNFIGAFLGSIWIWHKK